MAMAAVARRWCSFGLHGPGECTQEEEQGEADAVVCLAWPATEYISENDSVAARGHAERGEEKSWEWGGESS